MCGASLSAHARAVQSRPVMHCAEKSFPLSVTEQPELQPHTAPAWRSQLHVASPTPTPQGDPSFKLNPKPPPHRGIKLQVALPTHTHTDDKLPVALLQPAPGGDEPAPLHNAAARAAPEEGSSRAGGAGLRRAARRHQGRQGACAFLCGVCVCVRVCVCVCDVSDTDDADVFAFSQVTGAIIEDEARDDVRLSEDEDAEEDPDTEKIVRQFGQKYARPAHSTPPPSTAAEKPKKGRTRRNISCIDDAGHSNNDPDGKPVVFGHQHEHTVKDGVDVSADAWRTARPLEGDAADEAYDPLSAFDDESPPNDEDEAYDPFNVDDDGALRDVTHAHTHTHTHTS